MPRVLPLEFRLLFRFDLELIREIDYKQINCGLIVFRDY